MNDKKLLLYLQDNVDIFSNITNLKLLKFGYGQSNPAYLLKLNDGSQFVLKKKPSGSLSKSAHLIEREYRVMSALQNTNVPVPKTYHLCTDSSIIGTPFYICQFIKGRIFTKCHLPELTPNQRKEAYLELQRVLSLIHSIDLHQVGLQNYSKSKTEHIERLVKIASAQFIKSQTAETMKIKELNELYEKINDYQNNKRSDTRKNITSIVHGDYKFDNIIFDIDTFRILAVLDWELSTIGSPLVDIATFCQIYHSPQSKTGRSGLMGINLKKSGIPTEILFICGWIDALNKDCTFARNFEFPIKDYHFYLALASFRGIGILQGIFQRIQTGNASNPTKFLPKGFSSNAILTLSAKSGLRHFNNEDLYKNCLKPSSIRSKL